MTSNDHKIVPHEVATGITLDMARLDLGHPDKPSLWERLHGHCTVGRVVCVDCGHPVYLRELNGLRFPCHYSEAELAEWASESSEHRELKDVVSRLAVRAGLEPRQEAAGEGRKRVTDVLVTGGQRDVGWEIQLASVTPGNLLQRIDRAVSDSVVPSWLTTPRAPGRDAVIDRTPLTMIHEQSLLEMRTADDIAVRSGVKGIDIKPCGSWHRAQGWHRGVKCRGAHGSPTTTDRVPTLAAMIEGSASGLFVPVRWPRRVGHRKHYWIWATAADAARFWDAEGIAPPADVADLSRVDEAGVRTKDGWHNVAPLRIPQPADPVDDIPFSRVTPKVWGTSAAGWHLQCGECGKPWGEVERHERTTLCVPCATKFGWIKTATRKRTR